MKLESEEFTFEYKLNEDELMVFWNNYYDVNYYLIQLLLIDNGNIIKIFEQKIESNQTFCKIPSVSYGEYIVSLVGLKDDNVVFSNEIKVLNDSKTAKKLKKEKEKKQAKINKIKAKERRNRKILDILKTIGLFFAAIFIGIGKFFKLIGTIFIALFEFIGEHIKKVLIILASLAAVAGIVVSIIFIVKGCQKEKIYFGLYPQTLVSDENIINELNNVAGPTPIKSNTSDWNDYNYYISDEISSYMYYKDVNYEDNKYRGVSFTKLRPKSISFTSTSSNSYQDNNGYTINKTYWFKYEKIEWTKVKEYEDKSVLVSNMILDSQNANNISSDEEYEHNGGIGFSNNYELSEIRKWLNNDFYNTAFSNTEKESILNIEIDNSLQSTTNNNNNYICSNTYDNVFLLSVKEVDDYFNGNDAKIARGTDYAKSQGLYVDDETKASYWLTRSPYYQYTNTFNEVGFKFDETYKKMYYYTNVFRTEAGIRPAIVVKK